MVGDRIQANYDVLNQIARHFGTRQGQVDNLMQSVSRCVASLRAGGWVGKGAQAFYTEMDQIVFPAIRRLVAALHEGTQCTGHISRLMADAEREAAAIFANMGADTILVMTPGTGGGDPAFKMFPAQGPTPTPQPQQGGPFKLTDVWQEELTILFSQYDQETGYDDIVKKYLTNPDMMKYFGQAIDQLADHVNKGGAPLTPQQFYDWPSK